MHQDLGTSLREKSLILGSNKMAENPLFTYFLACDHRAVGKTDPIWKTPLPMHRIGPVDAGRPCITYGDYFTAIRRALMHNDYQLLKNAFAQQNQMVFSAQNTEKIDIISEKHGQFYHPAKVCVTVAQLKTMFALTAAVSDVGKCCINREFLLLKKLKKDVCKTFLPDVYAQASSSIGTDNTEMDLFIGQWFDGFCEFHLSADKASGKNRIRVWNPQEKNPFLTTTETTALYAKIAAILTCYYDMETFAQIFPWHHGAGDFVLKRKTDGLAVKLITVRQYASMLENPHENPKTTTDAETLMSALLFFLLNLSIRTRLDRIDGVGKVVWAEDEAVFGTVQGFFKALAEKFLPSFISDSLLLVFRTYLTCFDASDLFELSQRIVSACHSKAPELPVIKRNLKAHTQTLYRALSCN
jgi:hypothetical protein